MNLLDPVGGRLGDAPGVHERRERLIACSSWAELTPLPRQAALVDHVD
jgi:hypothetical protein